MEEIKVGEYVRDNKGYIREINSDFQLKYLKKIIEGNEIKKHSKNKTDIVELYDYVNYFPVIDIITYENGKKNIKLFTGKILENKDIETILTHEQYENNCYRIGE